MTGNDIVDIKEAKKTSNWQRPRFLEKLFTLREQQFIYKSERPFIMVWRLWSMKEAAYKLFTQLYPSRFYNPKGFECTIEENFGIVNFKDFYCYVETRVTSDYIISEARLEKQKLNSEIVNFNTIGYKKQSEELKSTLLNTVDQRYHIAMNEFEIPMLSNGKKQINISLTHHGRFGAYAIG